MVTILKNALIVTIIRYYYHCFIVFIRRTYMLLILVICDGIICT
jgi:hypothetical protein